MNLYHHHSKWIIWLSFFIAIVLQNLLPWPQQIYVFRPYWLNLMLIYWVMKLPHRVNVGTGFILGLIIDLIQGSILGVHALALSMLAYFVEFTFKFFCNIAIWQQGVFVVLLSLITKIILFCTEFVLFKISFSSEIIWSSLVDGILWPWLFLLMHKLN